MGHPPFSNLCTVLAAKRCCTRAKPPQRIQRPRKPRVEPPRIIMLEATLVLCPCEAALVWPCSGCGSEIVGLRSGDSGVLVRTAFRAFSIAPRHRGLDGLDPGRR